MQLQAKKCQARGDRMINMYLSLLQANFSRAIISWRFLVGICGVSLVLGIGSFGAMNDHEDVLSLTMLSGTGNFVLIVLLLPLIPFATSFAAEWEERAIAFWLIRTGVRTYASCKVIVSAVTGFFTTFVGIMLYAVILSFFLPFHHVYNTGDAYEILLLQEMPVSYLFFSTAHLSLSSAIFAVLALWISTYFPNRFSALALPAVIYFVVYRLTRFWELPPYLHVSTLVEGTYHAGSAINTLFVKLSVVVVFIVLMGYGTTAKIRRRVQSD